MITANLPSLPPLPELPPLPGSNPTGAQTQWVAGRVNFENLNYRVSVGDDSSVWVANKNTQEQYLAWGPSQLWVDGKQAFEFSGSTSLALHDGTLLTLTTAALGKDPLLTAVQKVTITQNDYGVEILGLDPSRDSSGLRYVETQCYGWLLDAVVADGNVIHENEMGAGFVGNHIQPEEGPAGTVQWLPVDQTYINATDLARLGALAGTRGAAYLSLNSLLAITYAGAFRGPLAYRYSDWVDVPLNPNTASQEEGLARRWRLRVPRDGAFELWVERPAAAGRKPS
jgi:Domain of Unknown Function (DUF1521)